MKRNVTLLVVVWAVAGVVALGCSKQKQEAAKGHEAEKDYMVMGEYVNAQDSLPRIRYFEDSQVSLNDRCAVRKAKLNTKMPPIYVNGQPVGFC
jgi:hypothetical protein